MKKIKSEHARALRFMPMNLGHWRRRGES
jgi:hypothetical protein